ncbi:Uncharacterized protein SCF082_LOCUS31619, partial [Durusdinium trenchii]
VLQELPKSLGSSLGCDAKHPLRELAPLTVPSNRSGGGKLSNFKETWNSENCRYAIKNSEQYEAGGSLYWLQLGFCSDGVLLLEEPSVEEVLLAMDALMPAEASKLFFPDAFATYASASAVTGDGFPSGLQLLHRHVQVFAWYTAMAKALQSTDSSRVEKLHEMALTATIRVHATTEVLPVNVLSLRLSEKAKVEDKGDSFVLFAKKVSLIRREHSSAPFGEFLQKLIDEGIRFNGKLVHRTLLQAVQSVDSLLTPSAEKVLGQTQREFGRSVWAESYTKLARVSQSCVKYCSQPNSKLVASELFKLTLETFVMQLRRGLVPASFFTQEALEPRGMQSDGCTSKDQRAHLTDVLGKIGTPTLYEHEIPLTETTEAAAADGEELTQHEDAFAKLTSDLPKPYRAVAELVQGLWEGDYEKEIKELFASDPDAQNSILSESQQTKSSKLSKGFRAAAAALSQEHVSCNTAAPPVSLRELVRRNSYGDEDREAREVERTNLWKEGQLNETHRAFVFSCDLWSEGPEAWSKQQAIDAHDKLVEETWKFLHSQQQESDFVLLFDGCIRGNRPAIESSKWQCPGGGGLLDFCAARTASQKKPNVRGRKVFGGAQAFETCFVRLAVPRVRLSVKDREDDYLVEKEDNLGTNDLTLVGIPPLKRAPQLLLSEKKKIFSDAAVPDTYKSSSVPLFWAESKGDEFWSTVIKMLDLGCVVDCTPGSGTLARVCLEQEALPPVVLYNSDLSEMIEEHYADVLAELNPPD